MAVVRLIVFGAPDGATALLRDERVRAAARGIDDDGYLRGGSPPGAAVDAGLFVRRGGRWMAGPQFYVPSRRDRSTTMSAAEACAARVAERRDALRAAFSEAGSWPGPWDGAALLVVGALLLDLFVGQALVDQGLVQPPGRGWRAWVLPDRGPSVGARLRYDGHCGCGVMWVQDVEDTLELLGDQDLRLLAAGDGHRDAAHVLRLRYLGWLQADDPAFLMLRAGDPLWTALKETARTLVDEVHRPLLEPCDTADDGHVVLARSRMVLDQALSTLQCRAVVPPVDASVVRRFVWVGFDWTLRSASAGGEGADAHA